MKKLWDSINSNPDQFMRFLNNTPNGFSNSAAATLDKMDPLGYLPYKFRYGRVTPFAGHSLGPVFVPTHEEIKRITDLQANRLHDGHFAETAAQSGNWFDCDIADRDIAAAQAMLGFAEPCEFIYTQEGLSANLGRLLDTFYSPSLEDWNSGKTRICHLGKEFYSDQAVIHSVINRHVQQAQRLGVHAADAANSVLGIAPDARGLYNEANLIQFVKTHAHTIKILHLSDVVFSTGQRLDLPYILSELRDTLHEHHILVGLDLAHSVGNRTLDLKSLPVTYAVGCAYKHLCGPAGSGWGIYVNKNADLKHYPPIQGWKAAASDRVFPIIDGYDSAIMSRDAARAFRCSNPAPVALAPARQYMTFMADIGWDKLIARSESLTRYMLTLLQQKLGDRIEFITPLDPKNRGAMLVFRVKGIHNVAAIEALMKAQSPLGQFEIDTRPPANIRVTAHYGYTRFSDIHNMVTRLEQVVALQLKAEKQASNKHPFFDSRAASAVEEKRPPRILSCL